MANAKANYGVRNFGTKGDPIWGVFRGRVLLSFRDTKREAEAEMRRRKKLDRIGAR